MPPEEDTLLRDLSEARFEPDTAYIARIRDWKATRDSDGLTHALTAISQAAKDPEADLMAPIIDGYQADATQGEMASALRLGYGLLADPLAGALVDQ
jgi:methylmalonyl-CoA mutase N-terminal domain/subunit